MIDPEISHTMNYGQYMNKQSFPSTKHLCVESRKLTQLPCPLPAFVIRRERQHIGLDTSCAAVSLRIITRSTCGDMQLTCEEVQKMNEVLCDVDS